MKLSSEQKAILASSNKNMIVSAQAGAGKSSVMVKRIVDEIVERGFSIDRILVITFTKKAAFEMSLKIRQEIKDRLEKGDKALKIKLYRQLNLLNSANIQTVHAFCYETIKNYFEYLDLDPNIKVLDGRALQEITDRALDLAMNKAYGSGYEDQEAIDFFIEAYADSNRRGDRGIRELILSYASICSNSEDPLEASQEFLKNVSGEDFFKKIKDEYIDQYIFPKLKDIENNIFIIEKLLDQGGPESVIKHQREEIAEIRNVIFGQGPLGLAENYYELEEKRKNELLENWEKNSFTCSFASFPGRMPKDADEFIIEQKNRIKDLRDKNKSDFDSLNKLWGTAFAFSEERQKALISTYMSALSQLFQTYYKSLMELKREEAGLDFNDIEFYMLKLLKKEDLVKKLKDKYQLIFFDEYQDANAKQEMIVDRLANDKSLFFVGDLKQCIYAFRQAVPENFLSRYKSYEQDEDSYALSMTLNFRAGANILNFINKIFIPLMTEARGGLDYDDPIHRARPGLEDKKGSVKLTLIRKDMADKDPDNYLDRLSPEAFYVLNEIRDYLEEGGQYGDCNILARTNFALRDFEKVFDAYKIPYVSDRGKSLADSLEYKIVINFLSFLDNIYRDIALLSSMLSFMGDFNDRELAEIRLAYPNLSFSRAFLSLVKEDNPAIDQEIKDKILKLIDMRDKYNMKLKEMPFDDWLDFVFLDSGLYTYVKGLEEGTARLSAINQILDLAASYSNRDMVSLSGFLDFLAMEEASGGEKTSPPGSDGDNAVRLMTIHQSKGLTLPVVFLVDMAKALNSGSGDLLIYDKKTGPALNLRELDPEGRIIKVKGLQNLLAENEERKRETSEEVRVLYVAMTRAVERLYIVGSFDNLNKLKGEKFNISDLDRQLDSDDNYLSKIIHILLADPSKFSGDDTFSNIYYKLMEKEGERDKKNKYLLKEGVSLDEYFINKEVFLSFVVKDEKIVKKEAGKISYQKSQEGLFTTFKEGKLKSLLSKEELIPLKMTVSEISRKNKILDEHFEDWPDIKTGGSKIKGEENIEFDDLATPEFIQKKNHFKANEIGSLVHRVFQLLPLKEYGEREIKEELDSLMGAYLFTKEERGAIDESLLLNFYRSELGKRIIANRDLVQRERSFTLKYRDEAGNDLMLDGQIDLFLEFEKDIILLDFKTDSRMRPENYKKQLYLYIQALEEAYKKPVTHAYLYWVRFGRADDLIIN